MGSLNGVWAMNFSHVESTVGSLQQLWGQLWSLGVIAPCNCYSNIYSHVYRELNADADALASLALDLQRNQLVDLDCLGITFSDIICIKGGFDGGCLDCGRIGSGFWFQVSTCHIEGTPIWHPKINQYVCNFLGTVTTSELTAAYLLSIQIMWVCVQKFIRTPSLFSTFTPKDQRILGNINAQLISKFRSTSLP